MSVKALPAIQITHCRLVSPHLYSWVEEALSILSADKPVFLTLDVVGSALKFLEQMKMKFSSWEALDQPLKPPSCSVRDDWSVKTCTPRDYSCHTSSPSFCSPGSSAPLHPEHLPSSWASRVKPLHSTSNPTTLTKAGKTWQFCQPHAGHTHDTDDADIILCSKQCIGKYLVTSSIIW